MVRPTLYLIRIILLLCLVASCEKEPCINADLRETNDLSTQKWFVADSIGNTTIVDKNGISQTLKQFKEEIYRLEEVVEDDCGLSYGSTQFRTQYTTSIQPYYFSIDINSGGANDDDFTISIRASGENPDSFNNQMVYNFIKKQVVEGNAEALEITSSVIGNTTYEKVLQIIVLGSLQQNEIEAFVYAQGFGLVQISLKNGAVFSVQN